MLFYNNISIINNTNMTDTTASLSDLYKNFIGKNWKLYSLYLLTLVSLPIQNIGIPHYYGEILSNLKDGNLAISKKYFGILLVIWVVIQILGIGISYVDSYLGPKFHSYIRQYFFELIVDRYNIDYQELKIGSILTKLIKLPWLIDDILNQVQRFLLNNTIMIISNIYYLAKHHYSLGLIYATSIGIVVLVSKLYYNSCNNNIKVVERLYDNCHEEIEDTLQNLLSIYTSQKIEDEKARIQQHGEQTRMEQLKSGYCNRRYRIYFSIINVIIFISLNYVSYTLFQQKIINISSLTSIFIINYTILSSLMSLFNDTREFMNIRSNVELIHEFIMSLPKEDGNTTKEIPNPNNIKIELKNIMYYHEGNEEPLYNNLNLTILPKQKVAIMGSIGSGKSTFAKLITRLQTFEDGDILINGVSITDIDINNLRKHIIYIPQHPKLFNRTLWENISYGLDNKKITEDDIYAFLKKQNMNELSEIFKKRMHESVGKHGTNLSGGQRQMVWLIRAVLKDSPVVILDEPSASLDPASTQLVHKMIQYIAKNKTVLLITHDKDLTKGMDRLIYFDTGKIVKDVKLGS